MGMDPSLWLHLVFLKSIQIFNLPFFLGIIMGDNHVAPSTNSMNLIANNLSISCLIVAT
jgi:hypothetical protein